MKAVVKFSVLYYDGKKGSKRNTYIVPEFQEITRECKIFKGETYSLTVLEQVDDFITEIDKKQWMEENDIYIIFDWEIVSCKSEVSEVKIGSSNELVVKTNKKTNSELVELFVNDYLPIGLKDDFIAVYTAMKENIKNLKFEKQIEIVQAGMSVAYKSATNVFARLNTIKEEIEKESESKKLNK